MKKLFLGSVALVALGLGAPAALAADQRVAAYAPPPPPVYTWSGCYVGASAGTSNGHSDGFLTTGAPATGSTTVIPAAGQAVTGNFDLSGFIGGFQGGCNWQWGAWVFGIEGDGSATNKSGQAFTAVPTLVNTNGTVSGLGSSIYELQERWLVTARGRLGLAGWWGDKTMIYVTGGAAWAKIDSSGFSATNTQLSFGAPGLQSDWRSGWTVGGGLEYALGYGWSVKSEYLYVDFGDWTTFTGCNAVGPGCVANGLTNLNVNLKDHIFRAGMNYKFW
jgi:outer membrane immunogenic protein